MPNIVYILTNESMPGLVKIGLTTDSVEARITQLSTHSGVPLPFECYFAAEVKDCARLEKILHQLFSEGRVNPKREFFRIDPEKVVLAIGIGDFKEITPGTGAIDLEEQAALEKVKARRPRHFTALATVLRQRVGRDIGCSMVSYLMNVVVGLRLNNSMKHCHQMPNPSIHQPCT